jgi:hypothetical protein
MADEELIARLRELDPVLEVEFDTHHYVVQNPCGATQAIEKALYLLRDQAERIEQLNAKLAKVEALVKAAFFEGNNGCEYVWTKTKTYQKLREITGDTDD